MTSLHFKNIRQDFPAYPVDGAYLDTATLGIQPKSSLDAQFEFNSKTHYTIRKSLHRKARKTEREYYQSKELFCKYYGGTEDEIAWIPNSDITSNLVLNSLINSNPDKKLRVFSSVFDHHSIIAPLLHLFNQNKIDLRLTSSFEEVCLTEFIELNLVRDDIIFFGHTTQTLGLLRDFEKLSKIANEIGAFSIFDLSRTAGQSKINLDNVELDIGIFDGSIDLLGPQGSGFLYVKSDRIDELHNPFPSSGNVGRVTTKDVREIRNIQKFELGAPNVGAMVGLTASIKYIHGLGIDNVQKHKNELIQYLIRCIDEITNIEVVDPLMDSLCEHKHRSNIITLNGDFHSHDVSLFLDESYNIQTRSGLLCSHPGVTELTFEELLQVSTHIYNDREDIDRLTEGLTEILSIMG